VVDAAGLVGAGDGRLIRGPAPVVPPARLPAGLGDRGPGLDGGDLAGEGLDDQGRVPAVAGPRGVEDRVGLLRLPVGDGPLLPAAGRGQGGRVALGDGRRGVRCAAGQGGRRAQGGEDCEGGRNGAPGHRPSRETHSGKSRKPRVPSGRGAPRYSASTVCAADDSVDSFNPRPSPSATLPPKEAASVVFSWTLVEPVALSYSSRSNSPAPSGGSRSRSLPSSKTWLKARAGIPVSPCSSRYRSATARSSGVSRARVVRVSCRMLAPSLSFRPPLPPLYLLPRRSLLTSDSSTEVV